MIFLTHEQVDQLAQVCAPYDTLVHVLDYTGIRWGEAAALRVGRVDLERRRLSIDEATSEVGGKVILGTHKCRVVPFPATLAGPLIELIAGRGPDELLFADDLDSVAERLDVAAAQSRADSLRTADVLTLAEAWSKRASQGSDLRKRGVGPVGFEPTTYGL